MRHPGRIDPVHILGRGKAVHQNDGIALAFVEIGNLDPGIVETRHELSLISCWREILFTLSQRLPAPAATAARGQRRSQASVSRSVRDLIEATRPNRNTSALNSQLARLKAPAVKQQRAAAENFQDRPRLAALAFGEPRRAREILRIVGDLDDVERGANAGLLADPADILDRRDQQSRLLGPDRRLDRAERLPSAASPTHWRPPAAACRYRPPRLRSAAPSRSARR